MKILILLFTAALLLWSVYLFFDKSRIEKKSQEPLMAPTVAAIPTQTRYRCPGKYINCMPMLTEEAAQLCTPEAIQWYKNNCPDFENATY